MLKKAIYLCAMTSLISFFGYAEETEKESNVCFAVVEEKTDEVIANSEEKDEDTKETIAENDEDETKEEKVASTDDDEESDELIADAANDDDEDEEKLV